MLTERGVSIKQALEIELLKDARVVSGLNGLGNVITGVSIMEVPDIINWVKSGELLLTTAYSLRDDKNALVELISGLHKKGLAGIAIKTKRYIDDIPSEVVEISNKLGFPIIELPVELAFSDITNVILREIFDRQAKILRRMEEIHQKLMSVVLSGGGLKEISEMLQGIIENPLLVKDYVFGRTVKIQGIKEDNDIRRIFKSIQNDDNSFEEKTLDLKIPYLFVEEKLNEENKFADKFIFPIAAGQRVYGEIQIIGSRRKINQVDIRAVQYTCAIIALEIMKQMTIFEVESRHRNEFMEELLSCDESIHSAAIERVDVFGLQENSRYIIFAMNVREEMRLKDGTEGHNKASWFKSKLINSLEKEIESNKHKVLIGSRGDNITILIGFTGSETEISVKEKSHQLASKVFEVIERNGKNIFCCIGISRSSTKLHELCKRNEEARKALSFSMIFKNSKVIHYDELGIFRLLCLEHQEQEIRKFCQETVMPLLEYDKNKDGELVKTLRTYFECGGNLKKVCKQMYIHYNTILYRIQKIQQITGIDLSDSNSRLNLEISLKIMSMIGDNT
ncbi:MAG: PucR family transcriptional regulator [Bacillota bacterium]